MEIIFTHQGQLALYKDGKGEAIIFLHGGPGDTHHYMRRMSEPLWPKFQCINYDQRGVGASRLEQISESTLSLPQFFQDLLNIKSHLGLEKLTLVGHSWGAMLALYFNLEHSECVKKLALVSMGPIDEANEAICNTRLQRVFTENEKIEWNRLRQLRENALEKSDHESVLALDRELMALRVKSWVFDPDMRASFLEEYFSDPPPDRNVNKIAFNASRGVFAWEKLARIRNPVWICYGEQDFAPVDQANEIKRYVPNAFLKRIPECGHIPWLEQPEQFYRGLKDFLES